MIVCKSRKFIFLRVPKTASTSLSVHFAKNAKFGKEDFYTEVPTAMMPAFNMRPSYFSVDQHPTIKWFLHNKLIDDRMVNEYTIYGVLRNPIDRFFSMFSQLFQHLNDLDDISPYSRDQIAEHSFRVLQNSKTPYSVNLTDDPTKQLPLSPQSFWLLHNNIPINGIVIYPQFKNLVKEITGKESSVYDLNVGPKFDKETGISQTTLEGIYRWYKDDFILWETFTGEKLYPHASY